MQIRRDGYLISAHKLHYKAYYVLSSGNGRVAKADALATRPLPLDNT